MRAIESLPRYLAQHPDDACAEVLARLPGTLAREERLLLSDLYKLDWDGFQLAIEMLRDWRIDRYYANRIDVPHWSAWSRAAEAKPDRELVPAEQFARIRQFREQLSRAS